jgi:hypothetical protein
MHFVNYVENITLIEIQTREKYSKKLMLLIKLSPIKIKNTCMTDLEARKWMTPTRNRKET